MISCCLVLGLSDVEVIRLCLMEHWVNYCQPFSSVVLDVVTFLSFIRLQLALQQSAETYCSSMAAGSSARSWEFLPWCRACYKCKTTWHQVTSSLIPLFTQRHFNAECFHVLWCSAALTVSSVVWSSHRTSGFFVFNTLTLCIVRISSWGFDGNH